MRRSLMLSSIVFGQVVSLLCWLTLLAALPAQERAAAPDTFERATVVDARGLQQWAGHEPAACAPCAGKGKMACATCSGDDEKRALPCPECKGDAKHLAPCRACGGKGKTPDPLDQAPCPACGGATCLPCTGCDGIGKILVEDEGMSDCPSCRGKGSFPCDTCKGARLVEAAAPKPSLRNAGRASLQDALEATKKARAELERFQPPGTASRREVKTLLRALENAQHVHPALKRARKTVDEYVTKICLGEEFGDNATDEVAAMSLARDHALGYLRHQQRMLVLALARCEANEKATVPGR